MALTTLLVELGMPVLAIREIAKAQTGGTPGEVKGLIRFGFAVMAAAMIAVGSLGWLGLHLIGESLPTEILEGLSIGWLLIPTLALIRYSSCILMGYQRVARARICDGLIRPATFLALVLSIERLTGVALTPSLAIKLHLAAAWAGLVPLLFLLWFCPLPARSQAAEYRVRYWLGHALMLGFNQAIRTAQPMILILLMPLVSTVEAAGLLRLAQRAAAVADFSTAAVSLTIGPHIASLHAANDTGALQRLASASARIMSAALLAGTLTFALIGAWLIDQIVGPEFAPAYWPIMIMLGGLCVTAFLGPNAIIMVMTGGSRDVNVAGVAGLALCSGATLVLAPPLGASGGAIGALLAAAAQGGYLNYRVRLRLGIRPGVLAL
ncbi:MAG TPA: hypothetical protein VLA52_02775 [Thermohalobaculum sp.]|nr:hypothetical protein [Thermohalobaculum sp.]